LLSLIARFSHSTTTLISIINRYFYTLVEHFSH
jgi:hypothetical protein